MYKNQFPIFQNEKFNYLDTAASAQKPQAVIDEMVLFYQTKYANVHRGSCSLDGHWSGTGTRFPLQPVTPVHK